MDSRERQRVNWHCCHEAVQEEQFPVAFLQVPGWLKLPVANLKGHKCKYHLFTLRPAWPPWWLFTLPLPCLLLLTLRAPWCLPHLCHAPSFSPLNLPDLPAGCLLCLGHASPSDSMSLVFPGRQLLFSMWNNIVRCAWAFVQVHQEPSPLLWENKQALGCFHRTIPPKEQKQENLSNFILFSVIDPALHSH